jgi:hypothetical protein
VSLHPIAGLSPALVLLNELASPLFNPIAILGPIYLVLWVAQIGLKAFAFIDAVRRPEGAFPAADKQTKNFWLIILGLALLGQLVDGAIGIFAIIGTIAALVYVLDARPAVREVGGGGRSSGSSGSW